MTDCHAGYIVTLADDIREDDAEATLTALRMIHGVTSVTPIVANHELVIAKERLRREFKEQVWEFYRSLDPQ
jgi:hypothetical protein